MGQKVVNEKAILSRVEKDRRNFIKKTLIGSAFAAPLIASFRMDSLSVGSARACTVGNQDDGPIRRLICFILGLLGHPCA